MDQERDDPCRLYLITPPALEPPSFAETLASTLDAGDVASLQLRLKGADDDEIRRAAERLMPVCQSRDVAFVINDRPDLAAEMGADGVHIGQSDADYQAARRLLGAERIVGVTCHSSRHLAMEAAEAGADYVAFGAFFPTATKEARGAADIELLRWWSEVMVVPSVAIGGIKPENCRPLVEAGADFIAVVAGVWAHEDGPPAAVAAFNKVIEAAG